MVAWLCNGDCEEGTNMTKDDLIGFFILMLFTLGWFDWLWMFGVESSRSWTWWALIAHFGAS